MEAGTQKAPRCRSPVALRDSPLAGGGSPGVAIAIAAHPDDIEFYMAGTLVRLKQADWDIHYLNVASGNCGSSRYDAAKTRAVRRQEAQRAAGILGAHWHRDFTDDLEILYDLKLLRQLAAVIRQVKPSIVLTHSPQDYMEDHVNAGRLAVSATFARGMPNFRTVPPRPAVEGDVTVYHAMPHGLRDGLRCLVAPGLFINTTAVHEIKREALAAHQSQKAWLDDSQGMNSYLRAMDEMSLAVGKMSRRFQHAEGWRRHSHLGFSATDSDPLAKALGKSYLLNSAYEKNLEKGQ